MNWKKIGKYVLSTWIILTILFIFWMQYGLVTIYGGHTTKVANEHFHPYEGSVIIENVSILSEDSQRFIANQYVRIEEGVITSIDSAYLGNGISRTIDGSGKYLIPGLIDSHVHLFKSPNDLLLYTANGVTQIREMIGSPDHLNWRQEIEDGRVGPEMFVASPRIASFGRIEGWFMSWSQGYINIPNAKMAERKVRELADKGYQAVKIYSQINRDTYHAVCKIAKELDMKIVGHIPWSVSFDDIYKSGQSEIAHFEEVMNALRREFDSSEESQRSDFLTYVDERSSDIANHLIANDISITSTLWLTQSFLQQNFDLENLLRDVELQYENPGISEWVSYVPDGLGWLPEVNRFRIPAGLTKEEEKGRRAFWITYGQASQVLARNLSEKGVNIMAGTDANLPPTVPGFSLHDELEALVDAGMSAAEVLKSATTNPAQWMGSNTGSIDVGRKANLVLLDNNPLDNIRNTRSIQVVIANGKLYNRSLLDTMLKSVKDANDQSRKRDISEFLASK